MDKDEIMHLVNATAPKYQSWGCEAHFQLFAQRLLQIEREAIAKMFDGNVWAYDYREIATAIRARGDA